MLLVALAVALVEVAALAAAAGVLVVAVVAGNVSEVAGTLGIAVFLLGLAALLGGAVRALAHGRRWGRGPVVTWQLLQGAIGATQLGTAPLVGGALLGLAVVALVGLLAPASVAATSASAGDDAPEA
jgi:hypothetical protein